MALTRLRGSWVRAMVLPKAAAFIEEMRRLLVIGVLV